LFSGCSQDVSGRYTSTRDETVYIDLKSDGTFIAVENMKEAPGKYEIEGDQIIMRYDNGMEGKFSFKDNKIDGGRDIFVKRLE
jgi:hypothetical protein